MPLKRKGGAAARETHTAQASRVFMMCDTCWGGTWAAWTGTLLYMCCPSAADAEHCSTHMQCRLFERTPAQITAISTKMTSDVLITFWNWWLSGGDYYLSHLERSHPDYLITVVKKVGEDIKDRCFWQNQFLKTNSKKNGHFIFSNSYSFWTKWLPFHLPAGSQCRTGVHTCQ